MGIVAVIGKMLLESVVPKSEVAGLVSPLVAELFALALVVLILGAALALVRWRRGPG